MVEDTTDWDNYITQVRPIKSKLKNISPVKLKSRIIADISFPIHNVTNIDLKILEPSLSVKIRKGKIKIDATIDLHGYYMEDAFEDLSKFLKDCYFKNFIYILVITGKSISIVEKPTIKSSIKDWIENSELLNIVHSIGNAAQIHGGTGAVYLKLRRR